MTLLRVKYLPCTECKKIYEPQGNIKKVITGDSISFSN